MNNWCGQTRETESSHWRRSGLTGPARLRGRVVPRWLTGKTPTRLRELDEVRGWRQGLTIDYVPRRYRFHMTRKSPGIGDLPDDVPSALKFPETLRVVTRKHCGAAKRRAST